MSLYKLKGTSGSVINQSFPLGESFVLGSSAECQVQIEEPGIEARHAEITIMDDHSLLLKDLGSKSGTFVNGEVVQQSLLNPGDEIHIGGCRWLLQAPGLRPERVLTADVMQKPAGKWPRVLAWTVVAAAAGAAAVVTWKPEWLDLLRSLIE
jgi:predicted component of type VI protein secretion system